MGLRAIHLFAGTGTMTRAFQKHGAEIVMAWEPDQSLAEVYRTNFPEVPLWGDAIEKMDMSQFPEYDLLLARIILPPALRSIQNLQAGGVLSVVEKTRPMAFCFLISSWVVHDQSLRDQVIYTLAEMGYDVQYCLMDAANFGGVPFKGRGMYVIGFRRGYAEQGFWFPEWTECIPYDAGYLESIVGEEGQALYQKIPEEVKAFIAGQDAEPGTIYYSREKSSRHTGKTEQIKVCEYCPKLNQREWYKTYVQTRQGVRRLTWREYLALQGDRETRFPVGMANSRIWYCLGQHGLYTVEYRIAERLIKTLNWEHVRAYEAQVPLYGMVLRPEPGKESFMDAESHQAFTMEVFRDSLCMEEEQKMLVVAESGIQAYAFWEELQRVRSFCAANPQTAAKTLGLEEDILRERLLQGDNFLLPASADFIEYQDSIRKFRDRKRGILVTESMWQGMDIPELAAAYVVGRVSRHDLLRIARCITRSYPGKKYARTVFCGDGQEQLLSEDIIEEWPHTQELVQSLWQGEYQHGYYLMERIKAETGAVGRAMQRELSFLYPTDNRRSGWEKPWKGQQLLATIWCLTSQYAGTFGKKWLDRVCLDCSERPRTVTLQTKPDEPPKGRVETQNRDGKVFTTSQKQGAFLEKTMKELLRQLFLTDQENSAAPKTHTRCDLDQLRRQNSGTQGGYDIWVVYLDGINKRRVCIFECKYKRTTIIRMRDVVEKLEQARLAGQDVEHWVLVAPRAKFANDVAPYLERLERHPKERLPIKNVQVWTEDSGLDELFGLVPRLYHAFYGDRDAPEQWTDSRRQQIRDHWRQKLLPVALLPQGLLDYPESPEKLLFDIQNSSDMRRQYEELYESYISLPYYDDEGRCGEELLETDLEKWLTGSSQTVKVLLGEFGDGKTFFLYYFCRHLLEKFREDPEENYLPICFSLKRLAEARNATEFIGERMKELGANRTELLEVKERYHVLACLDGLDEMTSNTDSQTLLSNVKQLIKCCEELKSAKILITSRIQCFEASNAKEALREIAGEFEVWRLAPIPREAARRYLHTESREWRDRQGDTVIQENARLLSLAGKPLFLQMIRELWEDGELVDVGESAIYDKYIYKCLQRKFRASFDCNGKWVKAEEAIWRIRRALQQIAVKMQENGWEKLDITKLESLLDEPLAKILWEEETEDKSVAEDARNRFSMRSLFKNVTGGEISFAHRSIREYFVGVHLLELLEKRLPEFFDYLKQDICSFEIYRFLANGIPEEKKELLMGRLLSLLPECRATGSNAAAKILQICFLVNARIPQGEWSGQNLDGVYIPGADLSGRNLSHASIRNANLNNVRLDDADCSYCDFTGSRLEETKRVEAVGQCEKGIRVIYADGVVRDWEIEHGESEICREEPEGYERATLLEQGWLALRPSGQWELYGKRSAWESLLRYWMDDRMTILDISSSTILLSWQTGVDRYLTAAINCHEDKVRIYREGDRAAQGRLCGESAAVVIDGRELCIWDMVSGREYVFPLDADCFKELAVGRAADAFHMALLTEGRLILVSFQSGETDIQKSEHIIPFDRIHHIATVREEGIALGGAAGTVFLVPVDWDTLEMKWEQRKDLQLGIYCRNVKTEGLVPLELRKRLESHR